jgi:putative membrane protein
MTDIRMARTRAIASTALMSLSMFSALPAMAATTSQDRTFAVAAAQGGMAEVDDAKVARTHGSAPTVKAFAAKMIDDHMLANARLKTIASKNAIVLPASLAPADATMKSKLATMTGSSFDSAYLAGQITGHEKMEAVMKTEIASGSNPELVAFAKSTLPTVEQHLALAKTDK